MSNNGNGNSHDEREALGLFDEKEAAERIKRKFGIPMSARTLCRIRKQAKGIASYYLIGGRIYYSDQCCDEIVSNSRRVMGTNNERQRT